MGAYINGFYVFAPVTDLDHAGLLWVASILSLLISVLTIVTRAYIKRRAFGNDDWFLLAAEVSFSIAYSDADVDHKGRLPRLDNISLYLLDWIVSTLVKTLLLSGVEATPQKQVRYVSAYVDFEQLATL